MCAYTVDEIGYPLDPELRELELYLAKLANQQRKQHSDHQLELAQATVKEYHSTFKKLWKLGWDGEGLMPDSELPDNLMPEYYLAKWRKE